MAAPKKSVLYNKLKNARSMGVPVKFDKSYVEYTEKELEDLIEVYQIDDSFNAPETPEQEPARDWDARRDEINRAAPVSVPRQPVHLPSQQRPRPGLSPREQAAYLGVPLEDRGQDRAGLTFNNPADMALRVDSRGRVWYQDEVMKPAIPKPRMTRITSTVSHGVKEVETRNPDGTLNERFEVAGDENKKVEIRITTPSWQIGLYRDPRLPFMVHTYGGVAGFDYREIVAHYGGSELVPSTIKKLYVYNDLCFDIRSTRETMEKELRDMQLAGRIR